MVPCHRSMCCHGTLSQIRDVMVPCHRSMCCHGTLSQINVLSWYLNTYQCVVMVPCHRAACFHGTLSQCYGFIKLYDSICTRNYFSRFQNRTVTADLSQTPDACYRKLNFQVGKVQVPNLTDSQNHNIKYNPLIKLWSSYDQAMIKLLSSYDQATIKLWSSYDQSMIKLW